MPLSESPNLHAGYSLACTPAELGQQAITHPLPAPALLRLYHCSGSPLPHSNRVLQARR